MVQMAPSAELRDVTAALQVITERQDKAKARINPIHAGVTVHQHIVQLNLPTHALPEIIISKDNEVTCIDQTNLAPLTSDGVQNLFKRMKGEAEGPVLGLRTETISNIEGERNDQGRTLEGTSSLITEASSQSQNSQLELAF